MTTQIGGLSANGAVPKTAGQVTGVLAPNNPLGVGTSAQNLAKPVPQGSIQGMINIPHTSAPTTPVKSTTIAHPSGTTITTQYHAPDTNPPTQTTVENPIAPIQKVPENNAPVGNTTGTQIQNVANTGQQTQNESNLQQGVLKAGQTTPDEKAFEDQYVKSVAGKQFGQLAPYAEASMYAGKSPEELQGLITAPDLVGRANADTGLYNTLGNAYGNAALAGLTAAQTSAARNLTANTTAYSGAQNQASRAAGEANTVLGAVAPAYGVQYGTQVGQPGLPNGGLNNSLSGVSTPANIASIQDYTTKINNINSQSTAVDNNFSRAINYATSASLSDASPIIAGIQNKFKGSAQGNTAIAGFNQVIGQLNQQAQSLGLNPIDPNSVTPAQLKQLQVSVKQKLANDVSNYQSEKDKLLNQGTSGSSNGTSGANPWH